MGAQTAFDGNNSAHGAAYVFNRHGGSWIETQKLTASDLAPDDLFGNSVAISGSTIVVNAIRHSGNVGQGSAYVFNHQGRSWVETQKLTASDGVANDRFGWSVAVSASTIVVGTPKDDIDSNINQDSVYVFGP